MLFGQSLRQITTSYLNTIVLTVLGTVLSLLILTMYAFAISRKDFKLRQFLTFFAYFTMLFNGGMVSSYIVNSNVFGMRNTFWVLLLPSLCGAYNIIVLRTFFSSAGTESLIEAAKIDGANELQAMSMIGLPLLRPTLITVGIQAVVAIYNDYIWPTVALTGGDEMKTFCQIVYNNSQGLLRTDIGLLCAAFIIGTIPLGIATCCCLKYYLRGMVAGAIKG